MVSERLQVVPYQPRDAEAWDTFVAQAPMATFLHTRRFLAYHGNRFTDQSLTVQTPGGKWLGVFPAALVPGSPNMVMSHPGLTYGGLLHPGDLSGERMVEALQLIQGYYASQGIQTIRYKAIPGIYHQVPADDDRYALFRLGARLSRVDLSSAILLSHRPPLSQKRRWECRQAEKRGITLAEGIAYAPALWEVLMENLQQKHQATPTHTLAEITLLAETFPQHIEFLVSCLQNQVVAGVVLWHTATVTHVQYMASSPQGYETFALLPALEAAIERAHHRGSRYFNFGISCEAEGRVLNQGLYQFKAKFGATGVIHEFYDLGNLT